MPPIAETLLDRLVAHGHHVASVGKVADLFAGKGISSSHPTKSDDDGVDRIESLMATQDHGLIFANLVDFDAVYGHRNDTPGYAANIERFDARLAGLLPRLRQDDLLVITADHGNDPTTPSTDHSREHVPLLLHGKRVKAGVDLGHAIDLRRSWPDARGELRRRQRSRTARASSQLRRDIMEGA